jgi:hypothetical protein
MRLHVEGHSAKFGYAISKEWSDKECSELPPPSDEEIKPVCFVESRKKVFKLVERWNRRFATHEQGD